MSVQRDWNWEPSLKEVPLSTWAGRFASVHEYQASPDGEHIAAIVRTGDSEFNVCVDGTLWPESFEKLWHLRYGPDGRLTALGSSGGEWTPVVDGAAWENRFGYAWDTRFSSDGSRIAVCFQQDMSYGMAVDDEPWARTFVNMTNSLFAADGRHTAAVVQLEALGEADIFGYQKGVYSAALDGVPWEARFVNLWKTAISPAGDHLAAEVRLTLYDYTVAVDGTPWGTTYGGVWEPVFNPKTGAVVAPVRLQGKWGLAEDGRMLWPNRFVQLWHVQFSSRGDHLAAVVAPSFGRWTVALDGKPWSATFDEMVTDLTLSPEGAHIAAAVKHRGRWSIAVDGKAWPEWYERVWAPVLSPNGRDAAARVERNGVFAIAVNGRALPWSGEAAWDPVFSADGRMLLVRSVEAGVYRRRVVAVDPVAGGKGAA